ncbi:CD276 antigen-like isoform X2 [Scyliorhinus canicula]|uniref:CD276 antigen-like isoform X2 n=1 Tax=Scyliorhinus canicula TaxID=7830 RepID=UPI0018F52634|nr:CD276 antigen-like isoform X2 [Scyliorhinus canicula]
MAAFRVQMVKKELTAIINQTVVLGCNFTVTEELSFENILVTWQRVESNEVVHSYYYGKDQFSEQDAQYSNRTSLFPEEFKTGNASLRLEGVNTKDIGKYQCYVSNTAGNDKGIISVTSAAYYSEPVLTIRQKLLGTILMFESSGYPKADISWYNGGNLVASFLSNCSYCQAADGLYTVRSTMEINVTGRSSTYTFVLRNAAVNQTISRTLKLLVGEDSSLKPNPPLDCSRMLSFILVALLVIIVLPMILHQLKYMKRKKIKYIIADST